MYRAVTRGVEVTVWPEFSPGRSDADREAYFWLYTIEIRNSGPEAVQLWSRHWRITDGFGKVQEVRGLGVVGEQPILAPGEQFRYTSGCPLGTPQGMMTGTYEMVTDRGERFLAEIPAFSLDSPHFKPRLN